MIVEVHPADSSCRLLPKGPRGHLVPSWRFRVESFRALPLAMAGVTAPEIPTLLLDVLGEQPCIQVSPLGEDRYLLQQTGLSLAHSGGVPWNATTSFFQQLIPCDGKGQWALMGKDHSRGGRVTPIHLVRIAREVGQLPLVRLDHLEAETRWWAEQLAQEPDASRSLAGMEDLPEEVFWMLAGCPDHETWRRLATNGSLPTDLGVFASWVAPVELARNPLAEMIVYEHQDGRLSEEFLRLVNSR